MFAGLQPECLTYLVYVLPLKLDGRNPVFKTSREILFIEKPATYQELH